MRALPGCCMLATVWWGWTVWPVRAGSSTPSRCVCWIPSQEHWGRWTSPSTWPSGWYSDRRNTYIHLKHTVDWLEFKKKRIVQHLFSSTISTLDLTCLNRTITSQLVHLWVFLLLDVGQGYFVFGDSNFAHQLFSYWFLYIGIFFMYTSDLDTLCVFYII